MEIKQSELEALRRMLEVEASQPEAESKLGWDWRSCRTYPAVINKLMLAGLVECTYNSNRYRYYKLTQKGKDAAEGETALFPTAEAVEELPAVAINLFEEIVGYNDLKDLIRAALTMEDPIHILLYGPPSIAKSMFLMDIERAVGSLALPLLGSATSHAGLWDMIAERRPRYLLIDEIEKMNLQDMAGLLSLMEHKRIIRMKVGRMLDLELDCRVFAAANVVRRLPPELLSRFWKYSVTEYNSTEYVQVVKSVLVNREGIVEEYAHQIAMKLVNSTHDVRDAIRVARLSKQVGVERALALWAR